MRVNEYFERVFNTACRVWHNHTLGLRETMTSKAKVKRDSAVYIRVNEHGERVFNTACRVSRKPIAALIGGAILPLAFAPLQQSYLVFPALLLFLISIENAKPKTALWRGLLFGIAYFGVGVSWIYISLHHYGGANSVVSGGLTLLFITVLALYPACCALVLNLFFQKRNVFRYVIAFPSLWVLTEYARSYLFTGFPWLLIGYTQTNTYLKHLAPIMGVYGISWWLALASGLLFGLYRSFRRKIRRHVFFYAIALISITFTPLLLLNVSWVQRLPKPLAFALVQGNIPQLTKWSGDFLINTLTRYERLTTHYWKTQPTYTGFTSTVIVWPEAAIPLAWHDAYPLLKPLIDNARRRHTTLIIGAPQYTADGRYYNAVYATGAGHGYYYKHHLVPFGEYIPGGKWLRHMKNFIDIPMTDFSSGHRNGLLYAGSIPIAPFICYEIAYPDLVLQQLPQAQLLITVTDDAWFGHSWASAQHLQIAQMRSLEAGRPQLLSTNNGITAAITEKGTIAYRLAPFTCGVLRGIVYPTTGMTPWVHYGNGPLLFIFLGLLIIGLALRRL